MADQRLDVIISATDNASATMKMIEAEIAKVGATAKTVSESTTKAPIIDFGTATEDIAKLEAAFGQLVESPIYNQHNRPLAELNVEFEIFKKIQEDTAGTFQSAIELSKQVTGESTTASILAAKAVLEASDARVTLSKETQKQLDQMMEIEKSSIQVPASILAAAGLSQSESALVRYTSVLGGTVAAIGAVAGVVAVGIAAFEGWDRIVTKTGEGVLQLQSVMRSGSYEEAATSVHKLTLENELLNFRMEHGVSWFVQAKSAIGDFITTLAGGTPKVIELRQAVFDLAEKLETELKIEALKIDTAAIQNQMAALALSIQQSLRGGDINLAEGFVFDMVSLISKESTAALAVFDAERAKLRAKEAESLRGDLETQRQQMETFDQNSAAQRLVIQEQYLQKANEAFTEFQNVKEDVVKKGYELEAKLVEENLKLSEGRIEAELSVLKAMSDRIPIEQTLIASNRLAKELLDARLVAIRQEADLLAQSVTGADSHVQIAAIRKQAAIDSLAAEDAYYNATRDNALQYEKDQEAREERVLAIRRSAGTASLQDEVNYWADRIRLSIDNTAEQDRLIQQSLAAQKALQDAANSQFEAALNARSTLEKALADGQMVTLEQLTEEYGELREAALKALTDIQAGLPANDQLVRIGLKMFLQGQQGDDLGADVETLLKQATAKLQEKPLDLPSKMAPKININGQDVELAALQASGATLTGQPINMPAKMKPTMTLNGQEIDLEAFESGASIVINPNNPATMTGAFALDQVSQQIMADLQAIFTNAPPPIQLGVNADQGSLDLLDKVNAIAEVGELTITAVGDEAFNQLLEFGDLTVTLDPAVQQMFQEGAPQITLEPSAFSLFDNGLPSIILDPAAFSLFDGGLPQITLDPAGFDAIPSIALDPASFSLLDPFADGITVGLTPDAFSLLDAPLLVGIDPTAAAVLGSGEFTIGIDPAAVSLFGQAPPLIGIDPAALSLFAQEPPRVGIDPAAFTLFDQISGLTLPMVTLDPEVPSFFAQGLPDIGLDPSIFSLTLPEIGLEATAFSLLSSGLPEIGLAPSASDLLFAGDLTLGLDVSADLLSFLDSDLTVGVNLDSAAFDLFTNPINVDTNIDPQLFTLFEFGQTPISLGFDPETSQAITSLGRLTDPGGFELDLQLGAGFDTANELLDTFSNNAVSKAEVIRDAIASGARDGLADGVVDAIINDLTDGIWRAIDGA